MTRIGRHDSSHAAFFLRVESICTLHIAKTAASVICYLGRVNHMESIVASNPNSRIELEYNTLMEEYKALRDEIISTLEAARQVTNYTLVLASLVTAALPSISEYIGRTKSGTIILIMPVIFYFLAWSALRYTILTNSLGSYIRDKIAPRVRICISISANTDKIDRTLFTWEDKGKNTLDKYGLFYLPIAGSHFALPLFGALALLTSYTVFVLEQQIVLPWYDILMGVANVLALIYSAFWGIKVERSR